MKHTLAAIALFTAATTASADTSRWVSAPNPDRNFPGTKVVSMFATAEAGKPEGLFNPGQSTLILTTVCGNVTVAGLPVVTEGCRTFSPGLVAPKGEPVLCNSGECVATGILK